MMSFTFDKPLIVAEFIIRDLICVCVDYKYGGRHQLVQGRTEREGRMGARQLHRNEATSVSQAITFALH